MAEVVLLPALCHQCLSVVPREVKVGSCNFCWSAAHHKLLILAEQSPPVEQVAGYLWIKHYEGFSDLSRFCGQRIVADGRRFLAQVWFQICL